ncbi:MAG TPA: DUF2178 domain-containing protein [Candidatus Sumerlaeota bacterium]|nr:DUF2178 domain-containing protein [Candidatus Sumerlaeota bacterium]HPS02692.1 DUF2178 domain-containing protein [Candidatus Sumerlaeota bacterium]
MHIQEQRAWFVLIVMILTLVLYGGTVALIGFQPAALAAFGFTGLAGGAPLIGRRDEKRGLVVSDERDREISRQAVLVSFSIFWLVFIAAALLPMFILGTETSLNLQAGTLPAVVFPAVVLVYLVQSLTTIVLYRRGGHAE